MSLCGEDVGVRPVLHHVAAARARVKQQVQVPAGVRGDGTGVRGDGTGVICDGTGVICDGTGVRGDGT
eukprot:6526115-Pyramimonas_sp.AAC.1